MLTSTLVVLHHNSALDFALNTSPPKPEQNPHRNTFVNCISKENDYTGFQGEACTSSNYYQMVMWYPWEGHSRA